ncbi:OTU domain-containing protein [Endozoicomonas euniceicola]|uniref:OTU family ubiquitin thioesterase n=1 Tax=Endozoicomonas euniceicola TaxID=1234143 RepID=A0ABY6H0P2_9GAMM|nr:OTU domain-containing protein [Endozoicomonas euniceicola]UYM17851.1 OTU family ubiquitin thioesterase [Endozoicomonas euniceicola]
MNSNTQSFRRKIIVLFLLIISTCSFARLPSPFGVESEDWNNILEELTTEVDYLRPAKANESTPPLNAAVTIYTLDIPDTVQLLHPVYNNVTRIQVIEHFADFFKVTDADRRSESLKTHILLTFFSGKEKLFYVPEEKRYWWKSMSHKFQHYGGSLNNVHNYEQIHKTLLKPDDLTKKLAESLKITPDSASNSKDEIRQVLRELSESYEIARDESSYLDIGKQFYPRLRELVPKLLFSALKHHFEESRLMSDKPPLLVSLGCGSGEDITAASRYLKTQGIEPQTLGIEVSSKLVKAGDEKFPDYNIIQGDALQSAALIRDHKAELGISSEALTLVIAEGLLNRKVLFGGTYAALRVLQQLIQDGVADMVVIAGQRNLLVDADTASASGWSAYQVMLPIELDTKKRIPSVPVKENYRKYEYIGSNKKTIFVPSLVLVRPNNDDQMEAVEARSLKRSRGAKLTTLDLSMFGLPLKAIEHFSDTSNTSGITQIDLSWSYLEDNQIDLLIEQLERYSELKHIAASGFEPWFETFEERIETIKRYKLIKRLDSQYKEELPSLPPYLARHMGQYEGMPNELVVNPKSRKVRFECYKPPKPSQWQQDAEVSQLNHEDQEGYSENLQTFLNNAQLKLLSTPKDGSCLYHALAGQTETGNGHALRQQLSSYLTRNAERFTRENPVFAGDEFSRLLGEIRNQNEWGNIRIALVMAQMSGRRVIVLYPQMRGSKISTMVFNPDGQGMDSFPDHISSNDIFLVHNGQGHWLGAIHGVSDGLQAANEEVLSEASGMPVSNDRSLLNLASLLLLLGVRTNSGLQ